MNILALVTARGGSKGFPGKNTAPLAGRPLAAWAHRALAQLRERVPGVRIHLSTDSADIAACWPVEDRPRRLRPAHLAGDASSSLDVCLHELDAAAAEGFTADALILLQPTSPLIASEDLVALAQALEQAPSALCVAPVAHPVEWSLRIRDGVVAAALPELSDRRRQELELAFLPCGAWAVRADELRATRTFAVPGRSRAVVIPAARAADIDHPIDLAIAGQQLAALHPERPFAIGAKRLGGGAPAFVIAEAGVNHNGDPALARALVQAAARSGADAVKFQSFKSEALVTGAARQADYQAANTGVRESQLAMLKRLEFPLPVYRDLKREAEELGLVFLSSPFEEASADELRELGIAAFKLGSGELTNLPLLARIAAMGRPLLLSTGMCDLDEVELAAACVRAAGDPPVAWLHCVSSYPAPPEQSNLRAMDAIRAAVGGPVGMSDHSMEWQVTLAAIARGAQVIEKHLTLDRGMPGPDHKASIEPAEFAQMMRDIRLVESALGDGRKLPATCELDTRAVARKSVVAARDLPAGHVLTLADLAIKRPGTGIAPGRAPTLAGRRLLRGLAQDALIAWDDLAPLP